MIQVAIRIKSEPDGPGFKLTSPASKMQTQYDCLIVKQFALQHTSPYQVQNKTEFFLHTLHN